MYGTIKYKASGLLNMPTDFRSQLVKSPWFLWFMTGPIAEEWLFLFENRVPVNLAIHLAVFLMLLPQSTYNDLGKSIAANPANSWILILPVFTVIATLTLNIYVKNPILENKIIKDILANKALAVALGLIMLMVAIVYTLGLGLYGVFFLLAANYNYLIASKTMLELLQLQSPESHNLEFFAMLCIPVVSYAYYRLIFLFDDIPWLTLVMDSLLRKGIARK